MSLNLVEGLASMLYWTANMNIISGSHFRTRLGMKHEPAPPRIPTGTGVAVDGTVCTCHAGQLDMGRG